MSRKFEEDEVLDRVDEEVSTEDSEETEAVDIRKVKRLEHEKSLLLARITSRDYSHLITKVAHILNNYPNTRNSDVALQLKFWEVFQNDIYTRGEKIDPQDLYHLERLTSVSRARAKIQNEYGFFQSSERVRGYRRNREDIEREAQLLNKPQTPKVHIFCDESGKNGNYVIVGSVWILEPSRHERIRRHMATWKRDKELKAKHEFHFTEMKRNQLDLYKEFFTEIVPMLDMASFKAVVVKRSQTRNRSIDDIVTDLHFQLVHQGIGHEVSTGRIDLPRLINFIKDKEDGADALALVKIKQNLELQFKVHYENNLHLDMFGAMESYTSVFVQLADLFTGSLNRVLNDSHDNHKDEFSQFLLEYLRLDVQDVLADADNDMVKIIVIE